MPVMLCKQISDIYKKYQKEYACDQLFAKYKECIDKNIVQNKQMRCDTMLEFYRNQCKYDIINKFN